MKLLTINHYRLTDNQDSSPALTFPNVPIDFCPTGNWPEILQEFIDVVLVNGTINVPGLGDINPEEITKITEEINDIYNQIELLQAEDVAIEARIDALEANPVVTVRTGTLAVASGDTTTLGIAFITPMPTNTYGVSLTPVYASGTPATTPLFTLVDGSKTISGFTVRVDNNIASITKLDWMAVHTS